MSLTFDPLRHAYDAATGTVRFEGADAQGRTVVCAIAGAALDAYARAPAGAGSDETVRSFVRNRHLVETAAVMRFEESGPDSDGMVRIGLADLERAHRSEGRG